MALVFIPTHANAYYITNFTNGQAVLASDGTTSVETGGASQTGNQDILIKDNSGNKVAKFIINFDVDRDWLDITSTALNCNLINHQSVIHVSNFSGHGIIGSTFTLYVPKDTTASVRVCEGAQSLAEVFQGCDGHPSAPNVTNEYFCTTGGCTPFQAGVSVSIEGNYWKVEGVSGSGGQGEGGEEEAVPEFTIVTIVIAAVLGFGIYLLIRRKSSIKKISKEE